MRRNKRVGFLIIYFFLISLVFFNVTYVFANEGEVQAEISGVGDSQDFIRSNKDDLELVLSPADYDFSESSYSLPEFPEFKEGPYWLRNKGNKIIEDWSSPVIIKEDLSYNKLIVKTELIIDTNSSDRHILIRDLKIESNGKITIRGHGRVYLYVESDLNFDGSSSINAEGNSDLLHLYHNGNRIKFQGGTAHNRYKFSGNIYTNGQEVLINGGSRINGNIYASNGRILIRNGFITCQEIYARNGDIEITNGANVKSTIVSGGNIVRITGGSRFDGLSGGIQAPYANIHIDQGVNLKSKIIADPARVKIEHINEGQSSYWIEDVSGSEMNHGSKNVLNKISIYSSRNNPNFNIYFWRNNRWVRIHNLRRKHDRLIVQNRIDSNRILISNTFGFPITRIEIE
ncbi:MAG: DUF7305 domain-containing protein [Halanaerobiales bacterium]